MEAFLGFQKGTKGYVILYLDTKEVSISKHVAFHEITLPFFNKTKLPKNICSIPLGPSKTPTKTESLVPLSIESHSSLLSSPQSPPLVRPNEPNSLLSPFQNNNTTNPIHVSSFSLSSLNPSPLTPPQPPLPRCSTRPHNPQPP